MPPSSNPQSRPDLLEFHRPRSKHRPSFRGIPQLKEESKKCLRNLAVYRAPRSKMKFPRSRCAAVLVALFVGRMGDLYVLLSRRSATLSSYAGDTSLPGGRVELDDRTIEDTARREAWEEIGLPCDRNKVPFLCILEPFLTGMQLIVTPVVVLITDNSLRPILNAAEVTSIFSHPLSSFLVSTSPFSSESESVELKYHTYVDADWYGRGPLRAHRFLTGREAGGIKPVYGLTAGILIRTAIVGYGREPEFEVSPLDAPLNEERIAYSLLHHPVFRDAFQREGIDPDDRLLQALVRKGEKQRAQRVKDQQQRRPGRRRRYSSRL